MWLTYIFIVGGKNHESDLLYKLYNSPTRIRETLYNPTEQLSNLYNPPTLTRRLLGEL